MTSINAPYPTAIRRCQARQEDLSVGWKPFRPKNGGIRQLLEMLKTHNSYPCELVFCPKTPQIREFFEFSSIFLITFFGENEIMCTFAPK